MFEVVKTGLIAPPVPVNPTVRAGDLVHCVVTPRDQTTGKAVVGDMTVQMRQAMNNMKQSIEAAGGTLADVFQLTIYLTNRDEFAPLNAVYKEYFKEPWPSRATVVAGLLGEGMKVEIVAQAHIPAGR